MILLGDGLRSRFWEETNDAILVKFIWVMCSFPLHQYRVGSVASYPNGSAPRGIYPAIDGSS